MTIKPSLNLPVQWMRLDLTNKLNQTKVLPVTKTGYHIQLSQYVASLDSMFFVVNLSINSLIQKIHCNLNVTNVTISLNLKVT